MSIKSTEFGFGVFFLLVAVIATKFLPILIDERRSIVFVGFVGALLGRGIWSRVRKGSARAMLLALMCSGAVFLLSFILYLKVVDAGITDCSEDVLCSANRALGLAFCMFCSFSFMASQAYIGLSGVRGSPNNGEEDDG